MNTETITPIGKRIFVLPDERLEKTAAGVLLPRRSQSRPMTGLVVAVGPKVTEVKAGDRIIFSIHVGIEMQQGDRIHLMMYEEDALVRTNEA